MARHRMEVAVIVKERRTVLDAPGADQKIDRLVDGDPASAQQTEVAGGGHGDCVADHRRNFKAAQECLT